jgi:hypothetical protein
LEPARIQFGVIIVVSDVIASIRAVDQRGMRGMMDPGQILPAPDVIAPIGESCSGKVETSRNLTRKGVPGRADIGRPKIVPLRCAPR